MKKFRILLAFAKWLYLQKHPRGVRMNYSTDRHSGSLWFSCEAEFFYIEPTAENPKAEPLPFVIGEDGHRYVRVGGGAQEGKYIAIDPVD